MSGVAEHRFDNAKRRRPESHVRQGLPAEPLTAEREAEIRELHYAAVFDRGRSLDMYIDDMQLAIRDLLAALSWLRNDYAEALVLLADERRLYEEGGGSIDSDEWLARVDALLAAAVPAAAPAEEAK